ncbi:MAG: GIY-YIG nuclease family protein [Treponema sp.]|nr:GIY-YIG nuclease family protein [Treponema sp.]
MYYTYILSNWNNTVLYVGVTNDIKRRLYEHKNHLVEGFTDKYNVTKLVYFETTDNVKTAIEREKQLKKWSRVKKMNLIKSTNPDFKELSAE